jgi:ATP-dependent exoDNAse (exonuclease V) alpha subunit
VEHVLKNNHDRVTAIVGRAGCGKTFLMKDAVNALKARGHTVKTFAPTGKAARTVLRGEGFEDAETVAALLMNPKLQDQARGGVIWIDEAGLLSVPTMSAVFDLAEKIDARIILSGDPAQHSSVERGDALRLLQERDAIQTVTVSTIKRQTGIYKEAVDLISRGQAPEAIEKLDQSNSIIEIEDESRFEILASNYTHAIRKGHTALVISPTHSEIAKVTDAIRENLKNDGELGKEREVTRLRHIDLTDVQREVPRYYQPGWVLQAMKPSKGVKIGDRLDVVESLPGGVVVRDAIGTERLLHVDKIGSRFQCYQPEPLSIGVGEKLTITQTMRKNGHRLERGAFYEVAGFDPDGRIKLDNGWVIDTDFGHWNHGYAVTSHVSQGQTVDFVFISESSESLIAGGLEQFYVSLSRGKFGAKVYTDDRIGLLETVGVSRQRIAAMDLVHPLPLREEQQDVEQSHQRLADQLGGAESTERLRRIISRQQKEMEMAH